MTEIERVHAAAASLRRGLGVDGFDLVVVLGSGLGAYARSHRDAPSMSFAEVTGFPVPKAIDHAGTAHAVAIGRATVLLLAGRVHAYEGHDLATVVLPLRAAIAAGASAVVLTNASGGISDHLAPGDLTIVCDHINLAGRNPLVGPNDERIGPRFPDMTDAYTPRLRRVARQVAETRGLRLPEVVYAWWLGPSFETPAEIRMIHSLGADVVGMSTVPEVVAARHMGAEVAAFSLVTNRAAGLSGQSLSAEEVMATAASVRPTVEGFLSAFLAAST